MDASAYPVIVIGAGPVGLSLALSLLQRGRYVLVFEQRPTLAHDPRATTLQPPTLQMFHDHGVLAEMEARGRRVHALQYWDWPTRRRLAEVSLASLRSHLQTPYRLHVPQREVCQVLFAAIEALQPGTVQLGNRVESFTDHGEVVDLVVQQDGRQRMVRGSLLCAADGSRSPVRSALGIELVRTGEKTPFLTFETDLDGGDVLEMQLDGDLADSAWLVRKQGWGLFMRMADSVRFLVTVGEADARGMADAALKPLQTEMFAGQDVHCRYRAIYLVHQGIAERLHQGRVVLLGDAAHATFPVAGTAMNAGIHDAFELAGTVAVEGSLADWAARRRAAVEHHVNTHARATSAALDTKRRGEKRSRDRYLAGLSAPEAAREHVFWASMMERALG